MDYRLIDGMMHHVSEFVETRPNNMIGVVKNYNPKTGRARVEMQPEGQLTGWLPIASMSTGKLTAFMPPAIGEQVVVIPQDGDVDSGIIIGHIFSAESLPPKTAPTFDAEPTNVQQNEYLLTNGSATFKVNADGSVYIVGTRIDIKATTLNIRGDVNVTGKMQITGDISTDTNVVAKGEVTSKGVNLSTHTHSGVQGGGANSGPPVK